MKSPLYECHIPQKEVQMAIWGGFSTFTIWNRLHEGGIWVIQTANFIPMTHIHIQTHLQKVREHVKWTLNAWNSVLFTDESIVSVDFTDMPVRVLILPNERFSPFYVDIHDRFVWARLWLDKRSAYKERPICTIQGKTDLHNVDNITQTSQWYRFRMVNADNRTTFEFWSSLWTVATFI